MGYLTLSIPCQTYCLNGDLIILSPTISSDKTNIVVSVGWHYLSNTGVCERKTHLRKIIRVGTLAFISPNPGFCRWIAGHGLAEKDFIFHRLRCGLISSCHGSSSLAALLAAFEEGACLRQVVLRPISVPRFWISWGLTQAES